MPSFPDRLADAVRRKGPLCVGLDPRWEMLPTAFREKWRNYPPGALLGFGRKVLELIEPYAGIVKPQSAFFEWFGPDGMVELQELLQEANRMGFVTILDAKRGDIASTAEAYAAAAFQTFHADALTVNPYLGEDAVEPFITAAANADRGVFVLVRTSNKGAGLFQDLVCDGKPVYRHVADAVARWNAPTLGECGLGAVGAVVGATHPKELAELRAALPDVWFLVPGYGAQGGSAADVRAAYRGDGLGAVVNSSRGVTFPFHPDDLDWESKIVEAARRAQLELRAG
ncbi:MAG TPA: orotidine-5'-phosphate decarboxylase [Fimbriiglobus sp.]|jgi:orotidine-5'-phosphate decarboxylase|nr:orotidine-5'-phosphate decarboxylase [Fimbriiglobus sp.]